MRIVTPTVGFASCLCLVVSVLPACSSSPEQAPAVFEQTPLKTEQGEGVEIRTAHFDIRLLARDPMFREVLPTFMETAYAEYERLIPPAQPTEERLPMWVFQSRQQWVAFTRKFAPRQAYTYEHIHSGGYTDQPTATAVVHDIGRDKTLALLAHEGLHQYMARCLPEPAPAWVGEGLACQFEAFDLEGVKPVFTPRRNFLRRANLREALAPHGQLIPLPELLRMNAGDAVRGGGPSRLYYAQVWSLVLYLREGPYAGNFAGLLADVGTERLRFAVNGYRAATPEYAGESDGQVAFRHYITRDLDVFATQYRAFIEDLVR